MEKENLKFIGKSLYLGKEKILVIADLHLGYEQGLEERGILVSRRQFKDVIKELEKIFEKLEREKKKIKEIVILGDLKHDFSGILKQEWKDVLELIEFLKGKGKLILIKGNHDTILGPIAREKGLKLKEFYVKKDICFIHGNREIKICKNRKIKTLIMGHKHPAITIKKEAKKEKYKCFLVGKWKRKEIVILPSFFPLVEGSDVFSDALEDTRLVFNFKLKEFEVYIPISVDEVLKFGKVKDVGRLR